MDPRTVTLYSGGARGAEEIFGATAEAHKLTEVNFTFEDHHIRRACNARTLADTELAQGDVSMAEVSKKLGRDYSTRPWMRQILQSIWHQVNQGYQVFVVGLIQDDDTVRGGTGWAVELAKMWNRPLHVYDRDRGGWLTWRDGAWHEDLPMIEHQTICGTGTRNLSEAGKQAIEDLFDRSFST